MRYWVDVGRREDVIGTLWASLKNSSRFVDIIECDRIIGLCDDGVFGECGVSGLPYGFGGFQDVLRCQEGPLGPILWASW